jgi:deoxyribose-phosphate aldolase
MHNSDQTTNISRPALAQVIEHTLLKPDATRHEIVRLCREAIEHNLFGVCIAPCWLNIAKHELADSHVTLVNVVGFPHGNQMPRSKAYEAGEAFGHGAHEVDMVVNIGWLRSGEHDAVERDIKGVVDAASAGESGKIKVILETSLLSDDEIIVGCKCAEAAGAHFVKTSTGFSKEGATVEHVALMRRTVSGHIGVKAAGGIRTFETALMMLKAGAERLGCSASIQILKDAPIS